MLWNAVRLEHDPEKREPVFGKIILKLSEAILALADLSEYLPGRLPGEPEGLRHFWQIGAQERVRGLFLTHESRNGRLVLRDQPVRLVLARCEHGIAGLDRLRKRYVRHRVFVAAEDACVIRQCAQLQE